MTDTKMPLEHAGADGSCPDYGSALDPCPPGCASGKCVALQPELGGKSPADLILAALAAARTLIRQPSERNQRIADLAAALDALYGALEDEALEVGGPGHWHPATWGDVKTGDRIRVGGQHEATVEVALGLTSVASGATQVQVKLEGRPAPYTMPPSGPVEVWTPSLPEWAGQAFLALVEGGLSNA